MMPCSKRMALAVDGEPGSGCKRDCLHRAMVNDFRINHHHEVLVAEAASLGYATEYAEHVSKHPLTTFKDWLLGHRRPKSEQAAA